MSLGRTMRYWCSGSVLIPRMVGTCLCVFHCAAMSTVVSPMPASTDMDFFSSPPSKSQTSASSSPTRTVIVRVRRVARPPLSSSPAQSSTSLDSSPPPRKRKSPSPEPGPSVEITKKHKRDKGSKRVSSKSASKHTSASPDLIYRSSRSRSGSSFFEPDDELPVENRSWSCDDDGDIGPNFLSSANAVMRLIKSYKGCKCFSTVHSVLINIQTLRIQLTRMIEHGSHIRFVRLP